MSFTRDEEPQGRRVARLEARQLVGLGRHRALHVGRREDGQRLLERLGDAPVVDDQAVRLAVGRAVHARDRLEQRVLLQRRVQVHDLLDGRVEAGEQHVADDQDRERVARLAEARDQLLAPLLGDVVADEALARPCSCAEMMIADCGALQPVERLLVQHRRLAVAPPRPAP